MVIELKKLVFAFHGGMEEEGMPAEEELDESLEELDGEDDFDFDAGGSDE